MVHIDHITLTPSDLAPVVREALASTGLGINEAADLAGIPRTTFKRHLDDGAWDSFEMPKLARALGTTPSALWASAEGRAA